MEDWQKYIFDPKNPKGFKAYNLLKKIIKDGNTLLLTDMYYFNELYKNEIWTKDVVDELWDKPDNFDELSANEKVEIKTKEFTAYHNALEYSEELLNNGLATYIEVLNAREFTLSSELALIDLRFNELRTRVQLYTALGGGWK